MLKGLHGLTLLCTTERGLKFNFSRHLKSFVLLFRVRFPTKKSFFLLAHISVKIRPLTFDVPMPVIMHSLTKKSLRLDGEEP